MILHLENLFLLFAATLRKQLEDSGLYRLWRECSLMYGTTGRERKEDFPEVRSRDKMSLSPTFSLRVCELPKR